MIIDRKSNAYNVDLRRQIEKDFQRAVLQTAKFAPHFCRDSAYETGEAIHRLIRKNFLYLKDDPKLQKVKLPSALVRELLADCKSFSVLPASLLQNCGIENIRFRYAGYVEGGKVPSHIYVVFSDDNGQDILLDGTSPRFDYEREPKFFFDKPLMKIQTISDEEFTALADEVLANDSLSGAATGRFVKKLRAMGKPARKNFLKRLNPANRNKLIRSVKTWTKDQQLNRLNDEVLADDYAPAIAGGVTQGTSEGALSGRTRGKLRKKIQARKAAGKKLIQKLRPKNLKKKLGPKALRKKLGPKALRKKVGPRAIAKKIGPKKLLKRIMKTKKPVKAMKALPGKVRDAIFLSQRKKLSPANRVKLEATEGVSMWEEQQRRQQAQQQYEQEPEVEREFEEEEVEPTDDGGNNNGQEFEEEEFEEEESDDDGGNEGGQEFEEEQEFDEEEEISNEYDPGLGLAGADENISGKLKDKRKAKKAAKGPKKKISVKFKEHRAKVKARRAKIKTARKTYGRKSAEVKAAKKERRGQIKENAKKVGKAINKALIMGPAFAIPRGAFLALIRMNLRGLATNIKLILETFPDKDKKKIWKIWEGFGGSKKPFMIALDKGYKRKPVVVFSKKDKRDDIRAAAKSKVKKIQQKGISEGISTAAAITAAGAILGALSGAVAGIIKSVKPNSKAGNALQGVSAAANGIASVANMADAKDSTDLVKKAKELFDKGQYPELIKEYGEKAVDAAKSGKLEDYFKDKFLKDNDPEAYEEDKAEKGMSWILPLTIAGAGAGALYAMNR